MLMEDEAAARRGLAHLAGQSASGAVIAAGLATGPAPRGAQHRWEEQERSRLPEGATWLRQHVRSPVLIGRRTSGPSPRPRRCSGRRLAERRRPGVAASRAAGREPEGDRCCRGYLADGPAQFRCHRRRSGGSPVPLCTTRDVQRTHAEQRELRARTDLEAGPRRQFGSAEADGRPGLRSSGRERSVQPGRSRPRRGRPGGRGAVERRSKTCGPGERGDLNGSLSWRLSGPGSRPRQPRRRERALSERAARDRLAERAGAVATLRRDFEVRASAARGTQGFA